MTINWPEPEKLYIDEKPGVRYYLITAALSQLPSELDQQGLSSGSLEDSKYIQ